MGSSSRTHARTSMTERLRLTRKTIAMGVVATVAVVLLVPVSASSAQANLLGTIPGIEDVLEPGETLDEVTGVVTNADGTLVMVIDGVTGVVTGPDGTVIGIVDPVLGEIVPLTSPVPAIGQGGAGHIEFLGATVCSSDGTAATVCDPLVLGDLTGVTSLVLTAVPADEASVPSWGDACPAAVGAVCTIPVTDLTGPTPLTPVVTFLVGGAATSAPETRIVGGPNNHQWVLASTAAYRFTSSVEGSTFDCTVDGVTSPCNAGLHRIAGPTKGSHLFEVAATANTMPDPAPARRVFHVPADDRQLARTPAWRTRSAKGHFKNSYLQTIRRGSVLSTRATGVRRIVLVADRGRGHGVVRVSLGRTLLKKVDLHSRRARTQVLIPIKTFAGKRSGRVTVTVVSAGKVVRIDGLGIATR